MSGYTYTMTSQFTVERHDETSHDAFVHRSADLLTEHINAAITEHGRCVLGLSGGSTPKPIHLALTAKDIDWSNVHIFLMDERYIKPKSDDSNQRMIRETLVDYIEIPEENLIFPDTTKPLDECISEYTQDLAVLFDGYPPDVVTLGMGPDGHTTSLFPPVPERCFSDTELVFSTHTDRFAVAQRICTSPILLASCKQSVLMIAGDEKLSVFEECINAELDPERWPLHIPLATGNLTVITSLE